MRSQEIISHGFVSVNPSEPETGIFQNKKVNTNAADALAPCVTRSPSNMVLILQDKQVLIYHCKRFQPPTPSQYEIDNRKCKYILMFADINLVWAGLPTVRCCYWMDMLGNALEASLHYVGEPCGEMVELLLNITQGTNTMIYACITCIWFQTSLH